jgi:hypothetical protein
VRQEIDSPLRCDLEAVWRQQPAESAANLDGKLDIAEVNTGDSMLGLLLGNGDGTSQKMLPFMTDKGTRSVAIGDLNGDGWPDLAVANQDSDDVSILLNTSH